MGWSDIANDLPWWLGGGGNPYQPQGQPPGGPALSGAQPNPALANYLRNLFTASNPNAPRPVPPNSGASPSPLTSGLMTYLTQPSPANAATIPNGQLTAAPPVDFGPPGVGQGPFAGQPQGPPGAGFGQGPFAGRAPTLP